MHPRPTAVAHLGEYRLLVTFQDGLRAELDFSPMVHWNGAFQALREPGTFSRVTIDREAETLVWPGEIDICPDVLYHLATGAELSGDLPRRAANVIRVDRAPSAA
jgi:hypothetical protein